MANIDELEKQANVILQDKGTDDLSEVVHQLQILANTQDANVRTRALKILTDLAIMSAASKVKVNRELEEIIERANSAFYSARFNVAIKYYEQVLKIDPKHAGANEGLRNAKKYIKSGRFPIELLPSELATTYREAKSRFKTGNYRLALKMMDKALDLANLAEIKDDWKEGIEFREEIERQINNRSQQAFDEFFQIVEFKDLQMAYDFLSSFDIKYASEYQIGYIETFKHNYDLWNHTQDVVRNARLRTREFSSKVLVQEIEQAESLRQQYPENQRIAELVSQVRGVLADAQKFEGFVQNAKTQMIAANYKDALQFFDSAQNFLPVPTEELQNLKHIAQTNLAKQEKYYELMGRGRSFLDAENYEAAMMVFQEADNLIHEGQKQLLPDVDAPKYLIAEKGGANG